MSDKYILIGKVAVKASLDEWASFYEKLPDRQVGHDERDGCLVSTVFLGLDHQYGSGPPLLFETMIFPSHTTPGIEWSENYCQRTSTWEEAEEAHIIACEIAFSK